MSRQASLSERLSYRIDNLMTWHPIAKLIGLFMLSSLHIMLGAVLYYFLVDNDGIGSILWLSWTYTADPGTHAGESTLPGQLVSAFITLGGMMFFALFVGLVTEGIGERVDELKRGRSRVTETGHTLILGWSDKLFPLIGQLAVANDSEGGGVVVVLAERDKEEMEAACQDALPDLQKTTVVFRTGSASLVSDLEKVAAESARAVVVLADPTSPDSDASVIRAVLALCQGLPSLAGHVVAELKDRENQRLLRMVGGEKVEPVIAHDMVGRLMVQCARQPGLGQIYASMLGFEGNELYLSPWPELTGQTLGELPYCFPEAIVCGVRPAGSERIILCPPDDRRLEAGDELLVLAEDNDSYRPHPAAIIAAGPLPDTAPPAARLERILFCGWRRDLDDMLLELDAYVPPGSEAMLLAQVPLAEREERLWRGRPDRPERLTVRHRLGDLAVRRDLEAAGVERFDAVLILAEDDSSESIERIDSRSLVSLLLIRDIQSRRGREGAVLISEICDSRTKRLVSVTDASDYVVSNELISMALATVAEDRRINGVWMELFSSEGCEIYLKDIQLYARPEESLSFWELTARARQRGEVALGWQDRDGTRLNPADKLTRRQWTGGTLVVLAED
jgi:Trk K+ transport system NAD-binding subunit